jgi:hypothetical protein
MRMNAPSNITRGHDETHMIAINKASNNLHRDTGKYLGKARVK